MPLAICSIKCGFSLCIFSPPTNSWPSRQRLRGTHRGIIATWWPLLEGTWIILPINSCLSHACVLKVSFPPSKCSFEEVMPVSCLEQKSPSKAFASCSFLHLSKTFGAICAPAAASSGSQSSFVHHFLLKHRPQSLFWANMFEARGNKKISNWFDASSNCI